MSTVKGEKEMRSLENKTTDRFGNNTAFPDVILSQITIKGLLGKWTALILQDVQMAVMKYEMKTHNTDAGHLNFVKMLFTKARQRIEYVTPILEDLVNEHIYGMEDIFLAVYGVGSDEVYVFRHFLRLYDTMSDWDTDDMWDDCAGDSRLYQILTEN